MLVMFCIMIMVVKWLSSCRILEVIHVRLLHYLVCIFVFNCKGYCNHKDTTNSGLRQCIYCFTVLESGNLISESQRGWFPLRAVNLLLPHSQLLLPCWQPVASLACMCIAQPYTSTCFFLVSPRRVFTLFMSDPVFKCPLFIWTVIIGLEPSLMISFPLYYLCKYPIFKEGHVQSSQSLGLQNIFLQKCNLAYKKHTLFVLKFPKLKVTEKGMEWK